MVGYKKNDSMTQNQKLIAGCLSGVVTRFITQPLDIIKIRTQLHKKDPLTKGIWFGTTRKVFREEGITGFWHGHNIGQIHSVLAVSSQFYVYELATKYAAGAEISERLKPLVMFLCGGVAGLCSATLVIPLDVIRLRQIVVKEQYRGLLNGAKAVYNAGGIFAFYEGLSATLMQMGPAVGISFTVFEVVQKQILTYLHDCGQECKHPPANAHKAEYLLVASTLAGSCAGFVSKTITYPFDLAKRRMQIATHQEDERYQKASKKKLIKCRKLSACLIETYKKDGVPGLFRGWKVTIYKAQLTSVVAFTTYELICYAVREFGI